MFQVGRDELEDPGSTHDDQKAPEDLGVGQRSVVGPALLHCLGLGPVRHQVDSSDDEANNVDHPDNHNWQVEVEEGWGLEEGTWLFFEFLANKTCVDAHVGKDMFVTVALCVHHYGDQSNKKGDTLTKKDMKYNSFCLLVAHGVAVPETLGKGVGDVEGHSGHPAEEGDPGVLDDVAKGRAQRFPIQIVPIHPDVQAVMDPRSEESKEDVEKETDGELSKKF